MIGIVGYVTEKVKFICARVVPVSYIENVLNSHKKIWKVTLSAIAAM